MEDVYDREGWGYIDELERAINEELADAICHGILVSDMAVLVAKEMGEGEDFCHEIAMAGLLHDIGKIKMCRFLYQKQGNSNSLQIENVKYMKKHSAYSYEILRKKNIVSLFTLEAIYHHHENYDGSGYPDNLKGEEIPLAARILRACDIFVALTSDRSYRTALDSDTALQVMIDEVKNFDLHCFMALLRVVHSEAYLEMEQNIDKNELMNEIKTLLAEKETEQEMKLKELKFETLELLHV